MLRLNQHAAHARPRNVGSIPQSFQWDRVLLGCPGTKLPGPGLGWQFVLGMGPGCSVPILGVVPRILCFQKVMWSLGKKGEHHIGATVDLQNP